MLASGVQPPIVNIAGQPRRAFPPITPYPDSFDFTIDPATGHPGEGMVYEQQYGTYITPSPYDMERAMGFTPGATAEPVGMIRTAAQRRSTLGLSFNRHVTHWLASIIMATYNT